MKCIYGDIKASCSSRRNVFSFDLLFLSCRAMTTSMMIPISQRSTLNEKLRQVVVVAAAEEEEVVVAAGDVDGETTSPPSGPPR